MHSIPRINLVSIVFVKLVIGNFGVFRRVGHEQRWIVNDFDFEGLSMMHVAGVYCSELGAAALLHKIRPKPPAVYKEHY